MPMHKNLAFAGLYFRLICWFIRCACLETFMSALISFERNQSEFTVECHHNCQSAGVFKLTRSECVTQPSQPAVTFTPMQQPAHVAQTQPEVQPASAPVSAQEAHLPASALQAAVPAATLAGFPQQPAQPAEANQQLNPQQPTSGVPPMHAVPLTQQPQTAARVKASPTGSAAASTVSATFPQLSRLIASPSRSSSRIDPFAGNESLDLNNLAKAAVQKRKEQVSKQSSLQSSLAGIIVLPGQM